MYVPMGYPFSPYPYYPTVWHYGYHDPYFNNMQGEDTLCWCGGYDDDAADDFWNVITGGNDDQDDNSNYDDDKDTAYLPGSPSASQKSPAESFDPDFDDPENIYDANAFGLGFFAAIVIAADNVDLYLDGHTMEQSVGHALIQRFYANIELASTPFIAGTGPAQFVWEGDKLVPARNVLILGPGVLGRSSHHGKCHSSNFFLSIFPASPFVSGV